MSFRYVGVMLALSLVECCMPAFAQSAPAAAPEHAVVAQKSTLVARILADSIAVDGGAHAAAADVERQLSRAASSYKRAQAHLDKGEVSAADRALNDAMRVLSKVRNRNADPGLQQNAEQTRYNQLVQSVESLEVSYMRNVERRSSWLAEVGDEDLKRVKILVNRAAELAAAGQLSQANTALLKAQRDMLSSYNGLLGTAPLVYDLQFASAEEEYRYEVERGRDYDGLVPVAITQFRPAREAVALIDRLVGESRAIVAKARTQAEQKQFPAAIQSQRDAIVKLQQALELAGIVVPQRLPN